MKYGKIDSTTSLLGLATQIDKMFKPPFGETPLTYIIEGKLTHEDVKALNTILSYKKIKVSTTNFKGSTSGVGRYDFTLLVAKRAE